MSQISEINKQILTAINKNDPFYTALWGNEDFIPDVSIENINDFNCGACCNALEYVSQFVTEITEEDISIIDDPYIDIIAYFFTGIKRSIGEDNEELVKRMQSLIVRECNFRSDRFGTQWDILNVICYYLDRDFLYYVGNKVITDVIINGGFEATIGAEWTIAGGTRSINDSFDGSYKLDFTTISSATQTVSVTTGNTYIVHAFVKPTVAPTVEIPLMQVDLQRSSDSQYFNTVSLEWVVANPLNTFSGDIDNYQLVEMFLVADGNYDVDITFVKVANVYLDYVEFGLKEYPYFEIIYADTGVAEGFNSLWEEGFTPYDQASFLDQTYLLGSASSAFSDTFFQSLLDILKPSGVRAIFTREVRL